MGPLLVSTMSGLMYIIRTPLAVRLAVCKS